MTAPTEGPQDETAATEVAADDLAENHLHLLLAGLLGGAAVLHLVSAATHVGSGSWVDPVGFALFGWLQAGLGEAYEASRQILFDVDFKVGAGRTVAVVGPTRTTWPMTALASRTGWPMKTPEALPLSIST